MKRLSFLLLDANVVIHLFEIALWDRFVAECDVHLSRTVVGEASFYEQAGQKIDIDLAPYERDGRIRIFEVTASEARAFIDRFDPSYAEKLDPGETESLTYALNVPQPWLLCSADAIVFKVLGALDKSEMGISLEEILKQLGLGRSLPRQYCKKFREDIARQGFVDNLQGRGVKIQKT